MFSEGQMQSKFPMRGTALNGWRALCPAHADRNPSLSITRADHGGWLLKCWRGGDTEAVLSARGMTWADIQPSRSVIPSVQPKAPSDHVHGENCGCRKLIEGVTYHRVPMAKGITRYPICDATGKLQAVKVH